MLTARVRSERAEEKRSQVGACVTIVRTFKDLHLYLRRSLGETDTIAINTMMYVRVLETKNEKFTVITVYI